MIKIFLRQPNYMLLMRKKHILYIKGLRKIYYTNTYQEKTDFAILTSHKIYFKARNIPRNERNL